MAFDYTLITAFINGTNRGLDQAYSKVLHRREGPAWEREWERRKTERANKPA